jgi:hypothetical protein
VNLALNQIPKNQFYRSTSELARKVRQHISIRVDSKTRICDPSAGDGALLEPFLKVAMLRAGNGNTRETKQAAQQREARNIFAIEIDADLRFVLRGKGCSVLAADFLGFHEPQKFDVIVMNPPFNDGDSHVLHAWGLLADGGELVAILNKETIANLYSAERKLLAGIIESHGFTEDLGQAFSQAERRTNVETILVKLTKPKAKLQSFKGFASTAFEQDSVTDEEFAKDPLAKSDYIKALCDRYKAAEAALIARNEAQKQLDFYLSGVGRNSSFYFSEDRKDAREGLFVTPSLEHQLYVVKMKFWDELFDRSKLTERATSDFKAKFMSFAEQQVNMSFNYANCLEVLISVLGNSENIFKDAIDNVFKVGCSFDKANTVHWEGWAHNDSWKWNKKLIIPYAFTWSERGGFSSGYGQYATRATDFLGDLDKVLSMISGEPIVVGSATAYNTHMSGLEYPGKGYSIAYSSWIESTFIRFKVHKKGTIHVEFLDPTLLKEFNRRAAEGKPWMPAKSSYKQPKYRQKQLSS